MKIYPNDKNVKIKDSINIVTDIPLAYSENKTTHRYEFNINESLSAIKEILMPFDTIDNFLYLFDKYNNPIDYRKYINDFIYENGQYQYVPITDVVKFKPKEFSYYIKAKKKLNYSSSMFYNLNYSVNNNFIIANKLMQIFGDAYLRSLAPNNVLINNRSCDIYSLYNNENKEDGEFFMLKNLTTMITDDGEEDINLDYIKKSKETNLFFIVRNDSAIKDYDGAIYNKDKVNLLLADSIYTYYVSNKLIYNSTVKSKYYFNIPKDNTEIKYYSIFSNKNKTPLLIEERLGDKFICYITEDFFNNIVKNYKSFYELIMYIYCNSYKVSKTYTSWISDELPDYIVKNRQLTKQSSFISDLSITDICELNLNEIYNYNVIIEDETIEYDKLINNRLSFKKKTEDYLDPYHKKESEISMYIDGMIYIYKDFIYRISDDLNSCLSIDKTNNEIIVSLEQYRNSDFSIYIKDSTEIKIPLNYVIDNIEYAIDSGLYYIYVSDNAIKYASVNDVFKGTVLGTLEIIKDISSNSIYDMRRRGGGLPEEAKDNYDCWDIGNIYGRPYRKGSTLIITLPKKYEDKKDFIMSLIRKYMIADDYPILLFEEE